MVLLCRNNATINVHVKTQNRVKHRVWHTGPWPDPTRPKSLTGWPVTRRPGSISATVYVGVCFAAVNNGRTASSVPTSGAECPLRWIVHRNTTIHGVLWLIRNATTQQRCLEACAANSSCVAVEWSDYGCWIDDNGYRRHEHHHNVTTFVPVRPCDNPPGMLHRSKGTYTAKKISKKVSKGFLCDKT